MSPKDKARLIDRFNEAFLKEQIKSTEKDFNAWYRKVIEKSTTRGKSASAIRRIIKNTPLNERRFLRQVYSSFMLSGITNVIEKQRLSVEDKNMFKPITNVIALYGVKPNLVAKKSQQLVKAFISNDLTSLTAKDKQALGHMKTYFNRNKELIRKTLIETKKTISSIQNQMKSTASKTIVKNLYAETRKMITVDVEINGKMQKITRPQNAKEIQQALRSKFGKQIEWRVNRILDTELKTLEESNKWGQHKEMEYTHKKWNTQQDRRVRTSHRMMDGITIPINDKFVLPAVPEERVRGGTAMFPGDPSLPPEQRINERCFLTYLRRL